MVVAVEVVPRRVLKGVGNEGRRDCLVRGRLLTTSSVAWGETIEPSSSGETKS